MNLGPGNHCVPRLPRILPCPLDPKNLSVRLKEAHPPRGCSLPRSSRWSGCSAFLRPPGHAADICVSTAQHVSAHCLRVALVVGAPPHRHQRRTTQADRRDSGTASASQRLSPYQWYLSPRNDRYDRLDSTIDPLRAFFPRRPGNFELLLLCIREIHESSRCE